MNKSELKSFATFARRELLEKVALRAKGFGMDEKNNISLISNGEQLIVNAIQYPITMRSAFESLKLQYELKGYEQLMEEVAYTWFNRIVALRYMEIHEYLPERVNVLSSSSGKIEPDILLHYHSMELEVNKLQIQDFMDRGDYEGAYRKLFIAQCNALQPILSFLFEKIDDFTELLLPDYLLDSESIINKLIRNDELSSSFSEVEVIGWLYQYYMSEKKEQVGGLKNTTVSKEDLPVVTQLFTPRWIVEYMVQNSLGKLYNEAFPKNQLVLKWDYFLKSKVSLPIPEKIILENIKIMDPACGSGHILVYAFEMLYEMYLEAGYSENDIPQLILENNIYGLDIDKRAVQLANFALYMKAQEKNRRFLRRSKEIRTNIVEIKDSKALSNDAIAKLKSLRINEQVITEIINAFSDAKQYGSLIQIGCDSQDILNAINTITSIKNEHRDLVDQIIFLEIEDVLLPILKQAHLLGLKYHVVITNPPYHNKYNSNLKKFVEENYSEYKSDLYSAFIIRCTMMTVENGFSAAMTPFTWMFISTHEKLRQYIASKQAISSLIQLEYSAFTEATVPICTFVIHRQNKTSIGEYIRLEQFKGADQQPLKVKEAVKEDQVEYRYTFDSKSILDLPGLPLAYWISEDLRNVFINNPKLNEIAEPKQGLATADDNKYLKLWHEVSFDNIGFDCKDKCEAINSKKKWFPFNKGGAYRKWYGNLYYVVDWENDGERLRNFKNSVLRNIPYYFKEGITWGLVSSGKPSFRYSPVGLIPGHKGSVIYLDSTEIYTVLAILNSVVSTKVLAVLSPHIGFEVGAISKIPIINITEEERNTINELTQMNIAISKTEWDSFEVSWGFEKHPLIGFVDEKYLISESFGKWFAYMERQNALLRYNEEQLNRIFIDTYKLNDEIVGDVDSRDVGIRVINRVDGMKSFLSYFIGCLMGRYSLDNEGLAFAGGVWHLQKYKSITPTKTGTILITDEAYFEDDIMYHLRSFLSIVFSPETVQENINWIAESLELKRGETAEERIRRYFLEHFFKDHCQMYQNRPIYWLVDSGKHKGMRVLIYIHRYQPDTMATIRFEHLQTIQAKYSNEITTIDLQLTNPSLTATQKRTLEKKKEDFQKRAEELTEFDKVLADYANAQIHLDLDNGVVVNYEKFKGVLAKIK